MPGPSGGAPISTVPPCWRARSREVAGARAAAAVRREPHAVVLDLDPDASPAGPAPTTRTRTVTDDACACRAALASPSRTTATTSDVRSGPTRSSSRSSSRPPSTTVAPSRLTTKRRGEAEARPRERRLAPQPLDEAGGGVRVAQVVHDLPDLPHRAVDVVERLVDDRGQLGGVHAAGRPPSDGLQLQARREQLLDGEVVQVAGDALALVEQRREVLGVPSGGQLGGERGLRGERLRGGEVATARTGARRPCAAG